MNRSTAKTSRSAEPAMPARASTGNDQPEEANIHKVRELLFGSQAREFDSRIARLEERMARETAALREEMHHRLGSLEDFIKQEIQAVTEARREEKNERARALKDLASDLAKANDNVSKGLETARERLHTSEQKLRESLLQESKRLSAEIQQKHLELQNMLEGEAGDLRATLTPRQTLGDLLTEIGMRLKDELKLPGAE
jgi:hypothetical protein